MIAEALVALRLIVVHNASGGEVIINPRHIVSLVEGQRSMLHDAARCTIMLLDGKFVAVLEDCATVRRMIERLPLSPPP